MLPHHARYNMKNETLQVVSKEDMAASIIEVVPAEQKAPETQDCSVSFLAVGGRCGMRMGG